MKKLKCDICDFETSGETFKDWMESMKPHYAEVHTDFMKEQSKKPKEEQMANMQKWMEENRIRFENAS